MTTKKISIPPARDAQLRRLAKRIARRLFTYGTGKRARRLVFESWDWRGLPVQDVPGWYETLIIDIIHAHLRRDELADMRKGRK